MTTTFKLHKLFNELPRMLFPVDYDDRRLHRMGFFVLFEKGEKFARGEYGELYDRIVAIEHFDPYSFRDTFYRFEESSPLISEIRSRIILKLHLEYHTSLWYTFSGRPSQEIDDLDFAHLVEYETTKYITNNMSFAVFYIEEGKRIWAHSMTDEAFERYRIIGEKNSVWAKKIINTLLQSEEFEPSKNWLGKICSKGQKMWLEDTGGFQDILTELEFVQLENLIRLNANGTKSLLN